ncbi:salicylate hydroxylase [Diplogelasinospora grovesii]|uniref:Salicylate hydroxylase n=1 Tax=Diplogelasinospora grovesii TaxID=303347 RepID=A0AAN6S6V2_9PEZI|nr:salicylate hydroxylase [Diplogelasinospora grovesii]
MSPYIHDATAQTEATAHPPFRVAIVGGGIGGLAAALFLHHFCGPNVVIDVYEQAPEYKEVGAGLGLGVNATKLLHRIGVGDACNAIAGDRNGVYFTIRRWDNGAEATTISARDEGRVRFVAMARAQFLEVLLGFIKERSAARLHTRKKCRGIRDLGKGGGVRIDFEDKTFSDADLVIGCDGIHSAVRRQFVRDESLYSGKIAYRGLVPISALPKPWPLPSYAAMWVGPDKHLLTYPIGRTADGKENRSLNVVACTSKREEDVPPESWSSTCDRADVQADFGDCEPLVQTIISLMPDHPSKWRVNDREPLPQWTFLKGKVVLLGDAAHPMVPHQSAGAGQAVEDAYILAKALTEYLTRRPTTPSPSATRSTLSRIARFKTKPRKSATEPDLQQWMHLYQAVRFPRAQQVQQSSREAGELFEMQAPQMVGKTYEECLPILAESVSERMKRLWFEDIDVAYEKTRADIIMMPPVVKKENGISRVLDWCFCM